MGNLTLSNLTVFAINITYALMEVLEGITLAFQQEFAVAAVEPESNSVFLETYGCGGTLLLMVKFHCLTSVLVPSHCEMFT